MRLWIIGSPSSGKSTVAKRLAQQCDIPHIELDTYYFLPGWIKSNPDDFVAKVTECIRQDCWVIDGNYPITAPALQDRATFLVWLDLPLWRTFPRVVRRTMSRIWHQEVVCHGNRETLREMFFWKKDSMFYYALCRHRDNRQQYHQFWNKYSGAKLRITTSLDISSIVAMILHEVERQ